MTNGYSACLLVNTAHSMITCRPSLVVLAASATYIPRPSRIYDSAPRTDFRPNQTQSSYAIPSDGSSFDVRTICNARVSVCSLPTRFRFCSMR